MSITHSLFQMYTFIQLAQLYSWQIISDKHQMQTNSSFFTHLTFIAVGLCIHRHRVCMLVVKAFSQIPFLVPFHSIGAIVCEFVEKTCTHYKQGSIYYVYKDTWLLAMPSLTICVSMCVCTACNRSEHKTEKVQTVKPAQMAHVWCIIIF